MQGDNRCSTTGHAIDSEQRGQGLEIALPITVGDNVWIGNEDWNCSAPHGAGRLYSRKEAENRFTLEEYAKTMQEAGIYSTSVDQSTLDECPMAYKGMKDIIDNIEPTAEIQKVLQPVYNFKASKGGIATYDNALRTKMEA